MSISTGQALSLTVRTVYKKFFLLVGAMVICFVPALIVAVVLGGITVAGVISLSGADGPSMGAVLVGIVGLLAFLSCIIAGIGIGQATALVIAVETISERPITLGQALRKGLRRTWALLGTVFFQQLLVGLAFLCCFVPGLFVFPGLVMAVPIVVSEEIGSAASISRSWELSKGHRLSIFLAFVAYFIIFFAASALVYGVVFAASGVSLDNLDAIPPGLAAVSQLANFAIQIIGSLFAFVLPAVFYIHIREDKDGVNLEMLASVFE